MIKRHVYVKDVFKYTMCMYVFCCVQWGDRRRKDECSGGGKKQGLDGQGGGASKKQKTFPACE